jgi:DNA processing protein
LPQSLFARNRIIAGLAEVVIVIAARPDGGAVHTARTALREGRAVFAVKWDEDESGGNRQVLDDGASALTPQDDVLAPLGRRR